MHKATRPSNLMTAYWLIERPGAGRSEAFTIRVDAGREALPIFSFPDEAGMFLRLGGFEEEGWRAIKSTAGDLVSRLAEYQRAGIDLVALDPLPETMGHTFDTAIALVTLSLRGFADRHAAMLEERLARN